MKRSLLALPEPVVDDPSRYRARRVPGSPGGGGLGGSARFQKEKGSAPVDMPDELNECGITCRRPAIKNGEWPTIYMVPMELKRGDQNRCYEPVAVQIGLLRLRRRSATDTEEELRDLEGYKSTCVLQLISRHGRPDERPELLMGRCFESMENLKPKILACHSNKSIASLEPTDVPHTMLLDGCFILHRLLKYAHLSEREAKGGEGSDVDYGDCDLSQIAGRCCVWQLVTRDLLLLENQIPFFVLHELFDQLIKKPESPTSEREKKETLVKGSLMLFRSLCPQMLRRIDKGSVSEIAGSDVHHLLHLFYLFVGFPKKSWPPENDGSWRPADVLPSELPQWIPGAKELEEAGIRIRTRKSAETFLDIKFDFRSGVLEIPPLQLYDYSDALFRNLIAFEQTYPETRFDISTYSVFMNCLINTPEDMRILHLRGILVNMMNGEQDASQFFNRICSQIHFQSDNYLVKTMADVNKYKDSRWHKWRAALVRDYFSNPWVAISVVAAVLLLCMTVLQTFFTVYPYFKPSN